MTDQQRASDTVNEVRLVGRVSAPAESRALPSGDELLTFRLVVARSPAASKPRGGERRQPSVDTFDIACWSTLTRRRARALQPDDVVEVCGVLRRRFWRAPSGGPVSRCEVEAVSVARRRRAARAG